MADDIIRDLVRQVWKLHPEIPMAKLLDFEIQLRQEFGGTDYFVKKAPPASIYAAGSDEWMPTRCSVT